MHSYRLLFNYTFYDTLFHKLLQLAATQPKTGTNDVNSERW